jgi:hypothetical protein
VVAERTLHRYADEVCDVGRGRRVDDSLVEIPGADRGGHRAIRTNTEGARSRRFGVDSLRLGAIELHPHLIDHVLAMSTEVTQYQVRQVSRGLKIRVVTQQRGVLDERSLSASLVDTLRQAGLEDPMVTLTVPRLHRHERIMPDSSARMPPTTG